MFSRWFGGKIEPRPWERARRSALPGDSISIEEDIVIPREPTMTYRVEVGTVDNSYDFESDKPIVVVDGPETVSITVDDGESGTIKFYKRNLTFVQEYLPS